MTVKAQWLGHAAFRLDSNGTTVVIDPFFTGNPKYDEANKPEKIDLLLVTHGHNDHFGDTIALAKEFKPTIPVIHEMSLYLNQQLGEDSGVNVVGMNFGGTFTHESGIEVTLVPSSHSGGYTDQAGKTHYLGNPGGYVIKFPSGETFYHGGDTGVTKEMEITRELFSPKIGLLAIGGHYTMDPKGAAHAAKLLGLETVIPIHFGTWNPPLAGTPEQLSEALSGSDIRVVALQPGESTEF